MSITAGPDPLATLVGLAEVLRRAGVPASPDRVHAWAAACAALAAPTPAALYWAGRLTLCGCLDDVARYDQAYAGWLAGRPAPVAARRAVRPRQVAVPFGLDGGGPDGGGRPPRDAPVAARASRHELLRLRDIADLSTVERDEVHALLALLRPVAPTRPGRRYGSAPTGPVDPRRSLAALRRTFGEPARLLRRRRRPRPRRLVLLVDVSGSMTPYADALLRLGHAAVRCRPGSTEVFACGTRLTRVTRALRHRDPDAALQAAGALIPDWSGGTRLGTTLAGFVRGFGHPGLARRAIIVVCSDGWERGDLAELREAMARLRRLAYRLVWVSPHAGRPGFAPTAGGLAAVLPYLDALVAGHTLAALEELADILAERQGVIRRA